MFSYYSIASKATLLQPAELPVPAAQFEEFFGRSWSSVLSDGHVFNALDACSHLDIDTETLNKHWVECQNSGQMVKFGGGFYCGLVSVPDKEPVYVFNGFFMTMRAKYVRAGASIHYYTVAFPASSLSWAHFRSQVVGATDPAEAPATSLRGQISADWQGLGLPGVPTVSDNGVHASASPLEGMAERLNWLGGTAAAAGAGGGGTGIAEDHFGAQLLAAGVGERRAEAWCRDPRVQGRSVFDAFEDLDCTDALYKAVELNHAEEEEEEGRAMIEEEGQRQGQEQEQMDDHEHAPSSQEQVNAAWVEAADDGGNVYYYNEVTYESTWERPAALDEAHQGNSETNGFEENQYDASHDNNETGGHEYDASQENNETNGFEENQYDASQYDALHENNETSGHQYDASHENNETSGHQYDASHENNETNGFEENQCDASHENKELNSLSNAEADEEPAAYKEDANKELMKGWLKSVPSQHPEEKEKEMEKEAASVHPSSSAKHPWSRVQEQDGTVYFFNKDTGTSCWEKPEGIEFGNADSIMKGGDDDDGSIETVLPATASPVLSIATATIAAENIKRSSSHIRIGEWVKVFPTANGHADPYWCNEITSEIRSEPPEIMEVVSAIYKDDPKDCPETVHRKDLLRKLTRQFDTDLAKQKRNMKNIKTDVLEKLHKVAEPQGSVVDLMKETCAPPSTTTTPAAAAQESTATRDVKPLTESEKISSTRTEKQDKEGVKPPHDSATTDESSSKDLNKTASWVEVQDTDGEIFYYDQVNDESSWAKPAGLDFVEVSGRSSNTSRSEGEDPPPVRVGAWVRILGNDESGPYWTNEETGELKWETPEGDGGGGEDTEVRSEDSAKDIHRKELMRQLKVKVDEDIVFFKLELLKKSVPQLEQLDAMNSTADVLEVLRNGHREPDEEEKEFLGEDIAVKKENIAVKKEAPAPLITEDSFMMAQYQREPDPESKPEPVCEPKPEKEKEFLGEDIAVKKKNIAVKKEAPAPLFTEDSFMMAQYQREPEPVCEPTPEPEVQAKEEALSVLSEEPPSVQEEKVTVLGLPGVNLPPKEQASVAEAQKQEEEEVVVVAEENPRTDELTEAISTVGIVQDGEIPVESLVGHLVEDGVVAYLDPTHYPVVQSAPEVTEFCEERYLKRQLSCITTLIEDCATCEDDDEEHKEDAPPEGEEEEEEDASAARRRKLQIDLARSQKEAQERKERARLVQELLFGPPSHGQGASVRHSQRPQVWCEEMQGLIFKDLRCECDVTHVENEGILVSFPLNFMPPRLNEEEVTKYMTKLAIAGYPQKQRLRLCADRWGVTTLLPPPLSSPDSLEYLFFVPRAVLSQTKLPSSSSSSSSARGGLLSQTAPGNHLGGPGGAPQKSGVFDHSTAASSRHEKRSKPVGKLKPVRKRKDLKKKDPVFVVHVAPGFNRFEQTK
jgi:hypothetical protein